MRTNFYRPTLVLAVIVFLVWGLCISVEAKDSAGEWTTRGIGSKAGSCGEYVRDETDYQRWYEHWLMGYISGKNSGAPGSADFSNGTAAQGLIQWIQNYCKENPLDSFGTAIEMLLIELNRGK